MIAPVSVDADSLYDDSALYFSLGISATALASGRRSGQLRFTRIGKRVLYKGRWVLDWFETTAQAQGQAVAS